MSARLSTLQRAQLIREGQLDHEIPGPQEMLAWIARTPDSILPAMLYAAVEQCVVRRIFEGERLIKMVKMFEEEANWLASVGKADGKT